MRDEEAVPKVESALPSGWERKKVEDCLSTEAVERRPSIPRSAYRTQGRFPVVDQGQLLIAGFTDDEALVHRTDVPLIVFGDHTRAVKFVDFAFATGADGTKLLRAKNGIDPRFLYYALMNVDLPSRGYNRHFGLLRQEIVDLPCDQEEQREIARALSKLQAQFEVHERIVAALKELKTATMAKLFREGLRGETLKQTEIGEIPESWDIVRLGDLFDIQQGKALSQGARQGSNPRPFLRTSNVLWGRVDLSDLDEMDFSPSESSRLSLLQGDLLVCEGGDIGRTAIWTLSGTDHGFQNHIHRLRRRSADIIPPFFMYWMEVAMISRRLYLSHGNRTTIPNLSASRLRSFPLPRPQRDEQLQIADILSSLASHLDLAERRRELSRRVFETFLQLMVTGRLRLRDQEVRPT
jgi:type I restriction enzyme S subunit